MGGLRVLSDSAVHDILLNLSRPDILTFAKKLGESLRQFSTTKERQYQPPPGSVVRPNGQKVLFRPFTSEASVGTKIIVDPAPVASEPGGETKKLPLHGVMILCDKFGIPTGIINAEEVTGFRTSLSAIIPFTWRSHAESILVFGAGKQALWHVRLALALRGDEITSITLVNRSRERTQALIEQVKGENRSRWKSQAEFKLLDQSDPDFGQNLRAELTRTDIIFCTVPSHQPLFAAEDLPPTREKKPLITAIGSWQADMIEIDPKLIRRIADDEHGFNHKEGTKGGIIIVDDRDSVMSHTGEGIQSGLKEDQLLELGQVIEMQNQSQNAGQKQKVFSDWLAEGPVVYKSVGVGLTDLATGEAILEFAEEHLIGSSIPDF